MIFLWLVGSMARSLLVTAVMEAAVAWGLGVRGRKGQTLVLLANLATNPPLVAACHIATIYGGYGMAIPLLYSMELLAWLVEGWIYKKKLPSCRHPFALSGIANGCSYGIGLLLSMLDLLF